MGIKRFINAQSVTYHHNSIERFSEENKPFGSGVSKGYSIDKYSWLADFLFNHTSNDYFNPHIGTISFFSDYDIFLTEYGNINELYDEYTFLSTEPRLMYSPNSFELTTKQYSMAAQKYSEFDLIEYLNESGKRYQNVESEPGAPVVKVNHGYFRAPVFISLAYKNDMDFETPNYQYYDRYIWAHPFAGGSLFINAKSFTYNSPAIGTEFLGDTSDSIMSDYISNGGSRIRIIDFKIQVDNAERTYFDNNQFPKTITSSVLNAGTSDYNSTVQLVQLVWPDWLVYNQLDDLGTTNKTPITFYPEVSQRHAVEPYTFIYTAPSFGGGILKGGSGVLNPVTHLSQPSDQSLTVYNVCQHMLTLYNPTFTYRIRTEDPYSSTVLLHGIDINTEKNRRNTGVLTTEPYMVTKPIMNGQVVQYNFINGDGDPVNFNQTPATYLGRVEMYLQIKAPLPYIQAIDDLLSQDIRNPDIIHTFKLQDAENLLNWNADFTEFYIDFGSNSDVLFTRQDNALDDLVGGPVGTGVYREFFMVPFGSDADKYDSGGMRVAGMGMEFDTETNPDGTLSGETTFTYIYTTNYTPENAYLAGDVSATPIPNRRIELLDGGFGTHFREQELIRPMIKLAGINGFVKILKKNTYLKSKRHPDGDYLVTYNVEFPFAPGSFTERVNMDFINGNEFLYTQVLELASHIKAGSREVHPVDGPDKINGYNDRYIPIGDDGLTHFSLFRTFGRGEAVTKDSITESGEQTITYPANAVWNERLWLHMSLIRPQDDLFLEYGTYDFEIEPDTGGVIPIPEFYSLDVKAAFYTDNRTWKFGDNRYISYINRENPSYVCGMNVSSLLEDFTKFQKTYSAIPDEKRWLFAYFAGFAYMLATVEPSTRGVNTTLTQENDLTTDSTKSNIVIEIWDSESDVGNNVTGNWRPFSLISTDTEKVAGELIIDNLYIVDYASEVEDNPQQEFGDVSSVIIGFADFINNPLSFPDDALNIISNMGNLVLSYGDGGKNYHIVWAEQYTYMNLAIQITALKVYIREDFSTISSDLLIPNVTVFNPDSLPAAEPVGPLSISFPAITISKNQNFNFPTNNQSPNIITQFITRYIDLRSEEGTNGIPDLQRYVNEDNKILFRVRIIRDKVYPETYVDEDTSEMQYVDDSFKVPANIIAEYNWGSFPWGDGTDFDIIFDWTKIQLNERIRKFGMSYFKLASK